MLPCLRGSARRGLEKKSPLIFAPRKRSEWMQLITLVYVILALQAAYAEAREVSGDSELYSYQPELKAVDSAFRKRMHWKMKTAQEWNQLIPQAFRELVRQQKADQASRSVSLEDLKTELTMLEFDFLSTHLLAMEDSAGIVGRRARIAEKYYAKNFKHPSAATPLPQSRPATASNSIGMSNAQVLLASHAAYAESQARAVSVTSQLAFVEAFDLTVAIENAVSEMISLESGEVQALKRGWRQSKAEAHIPTLSWSDPARQSPVEWVPMISYNTIRVLVSVAERIRAEQGIIDSIHVDSNKGILFGKVAPGWNVHFSDQSEAPIFLDMNLQPSADTEGDRYFVFLNAKSGSQMVFLSQDSGESAGLAVPVMSGAATYLDLSVISKSSLTGRVYSATGDAGEEASPLSDTSVRILGQEANAAKSDSDGFFRFDQVISVGSYPFFVETDRARGFTHRYKVSPNKMMDLSLIRIPARKIIEWVEQIPGGMQESSGLVVAAVPEIVNENDGMRLIPSVRSLVANPLVPQTSTVAPWGDLRSGYPLGWEESRFVSSNLPEGLIVTQVMDQETKKVIWSELGTASPDVINIVDPN